MAQLFCDSFSIYATADVPTRWPGANNGYTVVTTPLPPNSQSGAQVMTIGGNTQGISTNNYGTNARMISGFRFYKSTGFPANTQPSGIIASFGHIVSLGHFAITCALVSDGMGTYLTDGAGTILGTGGVVPFNEWHHYEFDAIFGLSGSATLHLYLDGNPAPFITATGVSTSFADAEFASLGDGQVASAFANALGGYYADYYLFNGTGTNAEFNVPLAPQGLGAAKMAFSISNGPGAIATWTPNGAATVWQCIDQIPQDGDTTYASSATVGQAFMTTFGALPAMQTLISVQLSTYARTDDAGPRAYQSGFYSGGTYGYSGMNQFLGGSYNYIQDEYMLNPVNGLAWTPAALTGLQYGAELTI